MHTKNMILDLNAIKQRLYIVLTGLLSHLGSNLTRYMFIQVRIVYVPQYRHDINFDVTCGHVCCQKKTNQEKTSRLTIIDYCHQYTEALQQLYQSYLYQCFPVPLVLGASENTRLFWNRRWKWRLVKISMACSIYVLNLVYHKPHS